MFLQDRWVKIILGSGLGLLWSCDKQAPSFNENSSVADAKADEHGDGEVLDGNSNQVSSEDSVGKKPKSISATVNEIIGQFTDLEQAFGAREKSFQAVGSNADANFEYVQNGNLASVKLLMGQDKMNQTVTHKQVTRETMLDTFNPASMVLETQESFVQQNGSASPLDVLVIVDNSGSMIEEQVNLSSKLSKLLGFVENSDWRISVESTDPSNTCGMHVISKGEPNTSARFATAVTKGNSGSGNERGVLQAVNGLTCNGGAWLRPNSTLAVLVLSDEDNCSNGSLCGTDPWASYTYLENHFKKIRQSGVNARVFGLFWQPSDAVCSAALSKANVYQQLVNATNGKSGSVCDADYSVTLEAVSKNLSNILNTQFALKYKAIKESVEVYVNGQLVTSGYTITGNILAFNTPPKIGDQISVQYLYESNSDNKTFKLKTNGDISDIVIKFDQVDASSAGYSYDPTSGIVSFAVAPSAQSVSIAYKKGILQKEFPFTYSGSLLSSSVEIDGGASKLDYVIQGQKIVFNTPPNDGSVIQIAYTSISGTKLTYKHFLPNSPLNLKVFDSNTHQEIPYTLASDSIVFQEADFILGRSVSLEYDQKVQERFLVDLGYPIDLQFVKVGYNATPCDPSKMSAHGTVIDLTDCGVPAGQYVNIDVKESGPGPQSFVLSEKTLPFEVSPSMLEVKVNGVVSTDYVINNVDNFGIGFGSLEAGSKVDVRIMIAAF